MLRPTQHLCPLGICLAVFVPSRLAVANLLSSGELDGNSPNAEELQAILQNHIVKGRFTEEDLGSEDSVTTLGGGVLRIRTDETGSLLIGDTASIELPNMLASNGVAHIVDEIISEEATQGLFVNVGFILPFINCLLPFGVVNSGNSNG